MVDGRVVSEPGFKVDPDASAISVDGKALVRDVPRLYLVLNKPPGFVTTRSDRHASRTVMELVQPELLAQADGDSLRLAAVAGLHPVGRLDVDTTGVLLLTNDGELTHVLTHPSREVGKVYLARVRGVPDPPALRRLREGVSLEDGPTAPARARLVSGARGDTESVVELELHEGRKRQARRMLAAVGFPVSRLQRAQFGPIRARGLREGDWRMLTPSEVRMLRELAAKPKARPRETEGRGSDNRPRIRGGSRRSLSSPGNR